MHQMRITSFLFRLVLCSGRRLHLIVIIVMSIVMIMTHVDALYGVLYRDYRVVTPDAHHDHIHILIVLPTKSRAIHYCTVCILQIENSKK